MVQIQAIARSFWAATKATFKGFFAAGPFTQAAAISFYALLSLAPLVLIVLAIVGFIWGERAAQGELIEQIETIVGSEGAEVVQTVIADAGAPGRGLVPMIIGSIVLLIGATAVFAQLQRSLNRIWNVHPRPGRSAVKGFIRTRLLSLGMVVLIGALLMAVMVGSSILSGLHDYFDEHGWGLGWVWRIVHSLFSLALITLLIAMVFKFLPDVRINWRGVWFGAGVTALLFVIGQFAIGIYLGRASVGDAYGAAGSVVVLVVWIYYSALILLLGAQITEVYARRVGQRIEPAAYAIRHDDPGDTIAPVTRGEAA